ncbi:MAG: ParB/RepB/Spo0J family partition protein [Planctomycetota bacterium]
MVDRRLGRGLDFFLSGGKGAASQPGKASEEETLVVEVGLLDPNPNQPRKVMDPGQLQELSDSIKANGVLQPILARKVGDRFEIVAGERRWRASQAAGLAKVPVLVRKISDEESSVFALVENVQRSDLNAIEKATAFRQLQAKLGTTQEEIARRVGLDRSSVANFLRLLDLPEPVREHVSRGTLSMGHARTLLGLADQELITTLADEAIRQSWSVRELEQRVKDANAALLEPAVPSDGKGKGGTTKGRPVWLKELEETLTDSLAAPVSIRYGRKRSQIVIDCASREEFDRIYEALKGQ